MDYPDFKQKLAKMYTAAEARVLWQAFSEASGEISAEVFTDELLTGKPYQQILGTADFFGQKFLVDSNVLIPRPETEELLELAISKISADFKDEKSLDILDIGTGSGVISIILKKEFPSANITAIDLDDNALKIARKNAEIHQTEINFQRHDFLNWHPDFQIDILISNPPYIGREEAPELALGVKSFEPHHALFSPTEDALIFYRKIAADARKILKPKGCIFLEINQRLGQETLEIFQPDFQAELMTDLSGNDRFIIAKNSSKK